MIKRIAIAVWIAVLVLAALLLTLVPPARGANDCAVTDRCVVIQTRPNPEILSSTHVARDIANDCGPEPPFPWWKKIAVYEGEEVVGCVSVQLTERGRSCSYTVRMRAPPYTEYKLREICRTTKFYQ